MNSRRRVRLARNLGLGGLWLAAVLERTDRQLQTLETRLADAQATLAPFDPLEGPQTLGAVQALNRLAEGARAAPFLALAFGKEALDTAVTLTAGWEDALRTRPSLPALAGATESAAAWRQTVQGIGRRLALGAWAVYLGFTLLGAWLAAG